MTDLQTLSFSINNAIARLLNQVVVLLLGTPPVVVRLLGVVSAPVNTTAIAQTRWIIRGGYHGCA
jgi:hypothetical protein